jgi:hypothetical protein
VANRNRVSAVHKFFDFSYSGRPRLWSVGLIYVLGGGLKFLGLPHATLELVVELIDLSDLGLVLPFNVWVPLKFIRK